MTTNAGNNNNKMPSNATNNNKGNAPTHPPPNTEPQPQKPIPKPSVPRPSPFPVERIPADYDGRMSLELWENIQIPPDRHPFKGENIWETEICDFFEDCNEFCFAHCCYWCYLYGIFKAMDENICGYLLTPNPLIPIRSKLRGVLRIKGSLTEDCWQVICCAPCAAFQINQELKYKLIIASRFTNYLPPGQPRD